LLGSPLEADGESLGIRAGLRFGTGWAGEAEDEQRDNGTEEQA
jgi:hypothetical protein